MDRQAFETLALEHLDATYRLALQLVRHPDDAGDLVQETYLKALRVADRFQEHGGGIRPWLFKILHNVFYTRLSQARRGPVALEELDGAADEAPPPDEAGPARDLSSLDWEHVDERLKSAIHHLRPEYRTVLLLWAVEGMKYREIAEIQEIPIGTVMSRLHRARAILAGQLTDLAEETGRRHG
jgi:RNA polymerase sigma-70 factor, ECF subfamily